MTISPMRIVFVFMLLGAVLAACGGGVTTERLPILGEPQITTRTVNGQTVSDTVAFSIPDFTLINQDSQRVSQADLSEFIYVTDFFFTSCPDICPRMKEQMVRVYERFKDEDRFKIVSHTLDPEYDTPAYLKEYAERLGVSNDRWVFLHGAQDRIYELAEEAYLVPAQSDPNAPGGIAHSGAFILVDKQGRIRGYYDGTQELEVNKLMVDIERLLAEYPAES